MGLICLTSDGSPLGSEGLQDPEIHVYVYIHCTYIYIYVYSIYIYIHIMHVHIHITVCTSNAQAHSKGLRLPQVVAGLVRALSIHAIPDNMVWR